MQTYKISNIRFKGSNNIRKPLTPQVADDDFVRARLYRKCEITFDYEPVLYDSSLYEEAFMAIKDHWQFDMWDDNDVTSWDLTNDCYEVTWPNDFYVPLDHTLVTIIAETAGYGCLKKIISFYITEYIFKHMPLRVDAW